MATKKKFEVFVNWQMGGSHIVEADSLEEAEAQIENGGNVIIPKNGEMVKFSGEVLNELTEIHK